MSAEATVVVVNHDGGEMVIECVAAVRRSQAPVEIVVVDNASTDRSPERIAETFGDVTVVANERNVGFGAAANQGVRRTAAPAVVIVTSDVLCTPDAVGTLVRSLDEHPAAAAVGPLVRNPDGSVQPSKRSFPTLWQAGLHGLVGLFWPNNPGTRAYVLADAPLDAPTRVGWVSGACVALRRGAFDAVGGFDEAFFFFVEDVDLCRRLTDAGYEVWFDPRAEVTHAWGGTWTRRPLRFIWMHHANLFRYVRKHYRGAWILAYPLVVAGLALRFLLVFARWLVGAGAVPRHRAGAGAAR